MLKQQTKKIKHKTRELVQSNNVYGGLFTASFLESTIVPIPLEAVLIPLMQARRDAMWMLAAVATLGCITGAVFGYALGFYAFDLVKDSLIEFGITQQQISNVTTSLKDNGFWFIVTVGVTPIPFQVAMLCAGAIEYSLPMFIAATALSRAVRYFALAGAVYFAGDKAEELIKRYKLEATAIVSLVLITILILSWQ